MYARAKNRIPQRFLAIFNLSSGVRTSNLEVSGGRCQVRTRRSKIADFGPDMVGDRQIWELDVLSGVLHAHFLNPAASKL